MARNRRTIYKFANELNPFETNNKYPWNAPTNSKYAVREGSTYTISNLTVPSGSQSINKGCCCGFLG